jgi:hypothetical protein
MTLLRTVEATLPVKDDHQPAIGRALNVVGADVTMLLAVGHHNAQFIRISLDGVFLSVHGAEAEYGDPCDAICQRLGHPRQSQRAALIAREKCPTFAAGIGSGSILLSPSGVRWHYEGNGTHLAVRPFRCLCQRGPTTTPCSVIIPTSGSVGGDGGCRGSPSSPVMSYGTRSNDFSSMS